MEYNKIYESYMNYADMCKNIVKNTFFTEKDADNLNFANNGLEISDVVKNHRLKMIDIKLEHTMRMIEQVIKINEKLGLKVDLRQVIKVAVLFHDIGRLRQSTWCNTFNDSIYKKMNRPFNDHGEEGYDIFLNEDFNVDEKYVPVIGETILHHQDHHTQPKLNYHFEENLQNIDIGDIITGKFKLNDAEWQVTSLIVQLVADIDKTDILYQHLSSDFEMIRDYVPDKSMDTLDNISKKWGVSKIEIIEYNNIDENNYQPQKIKIPIKNMPIENLAIPEYMRKMFYDDSWPELKILMQDENWNFISVLWWRLSHFLNQISFSSTLINIEESKLLEQIYEKIPERIKPVLDEAFQYAKEVLIYGKIERNRGNIYLHK